MPIRILTTHLEFEGQLEEVRVVLEGDEPPVWGQDAELQVVGKGHPRVDGPQRVSGAATYTMDVQLPQMLHGAVLRSTLPHARIKHIETARAEAMPGVRAIYSRLNAAQFENPNRKAPIFAEELLYQGAEVAFVVAETLAQAEDAAAAVMVEYETLPFVVNPERAAESDAPRVASDRPTNAINDEYPKTYTRGDVDRGLAEADARVTLRFETPTALHNSLETHGGVARWDGDRLTVWTSTQAIFGARSTIAKALDLSQNQVEVICDYMGGGFGSKFGAHQATLLAAYAAYHLGVPVKCMLSRVEENLDAGNRPTSIQTYELGAKSDGTLTAIDLNVVANTGARGAWMSPVATPAKELYQCANVRVRDVAVRTNLGTQASFRAPGAVEGMAGMEAAIDQLAHKLGMDPLDLRLKNYADSYQLLSQPYARKTLREAMRVGAERIDWATRDTEARRYPEGRASSVRRGIGMACQLWGGDGGPPAQAIAKLLPDGTAIILTGTQDIGTGTRTVLTQIAAEELGYPIDRVRVELGDTEYGLYSPASGGSMTLASVGPAVRMAAAEARAHLIEIASHFAEAPSDALSVREGKVIASETNKDLGGVETFLSQLDGYEVTGRGMRGANAEGVIIRTFGAQFAEVDVDLGTGQVRVRRIVAVHDCGRIVNPLTFSSQIEGGIIQGLGFALMEQRIVDERQGLVLNPNLEWYKVPTIGDVPEIDITVIGGAEPRANTIGALGAGEPPIIPTPGAIANAVAHAIGRPVTSLPLTPDRVLDTLR